MVYTMMANEPFIGGAAYLNFSHGCKSLIFAYFGLAKDRFWYAAAYASLILPFSRSGVLPIPAGYCDCVLMA
jgi:hypothetical protein